MSSGRKDLCTFFTLWDTDRVLYNCQHPTIFGTLSIFCSTVFLISLSLVSKLKLNTRVLKYSKYSPKYSGTPWGTQILEYSMWYCLKYLYVEYFLVVKGLGSLKFLACHICISKFCHSTVAKLGDTNISFPPCLILNDYRLYVMIVFCA